jgi:hypothetical protein
MVMNRLLLGMLLCCFNTMALYAEELDAWEYAHSWEGALPALREGKHQAYGIFIGRKNSIIWKEIRKNKDKMGNVLLFRLSANDLVTNPYTGKKVLGSQAIMHMTGPLTDLTGGSFLFFDKDFILLPRFTLIQNFHRNRPEVLAFYCQLLCEPLRDKLTMAEFARYQGNEIGLQLTMEAESGLHKNFSHLYREIPPNEVLFRGVTDDGTVVDPRQVGGIHLITQDPHGEVFLALTREIWEKLTVKVGNDVKRPPLYIFGPALANYPALDAMGITYKKVNLTKDQMLGRSSPRLILPEQNGGNEKKRGAIEITGFIPGQVLGEYIMGAQAKGLLNDFRNLHPDIPIGDVDVAGEVVKKP